MKKFELPQIMISEFSGEILTASVNTAMEHAMRDAQELKDSLGTVGIYTNMEE